LPGGFFQNKNNSDVKECRIVIKIDNNIITDTIIQPGIWSYKIFNYLNQNLRIEVFMDNTLEIIREYTLDETLKGKIMENGIIDFY